MSDDRIARAAEALELALGDPHSAEAPSSFAQALAADEAEAFPEAGFSALLRMRYLENLIPCEQGGALEGFELLLDQGRVVARRDLSLAIATGQCMLGALPVWLAGSDAQRAHLATLLRGGESGALALTEEEHGSDLAASDVTARPDDAGGYILSGTKWCINNGTRGRYLSVLARTASDGGARGFSLFFVDKQQLDQSTLGGIL